MTEIGNTDKLEESVFLGKKEKRQKETIRNSEKKEVQKDTIHQGTERSSKI